MEAPRWFSAERLLDLLARQVRCYERLQQLGERQRGLICGDQPEALLNVLRERQAQVAELGQLNEALAPFRRDWSGTYRLLDPDQQQRANELLGRMNGMLRVILDSDDSDGQLLAARKQAVGQEIAGMRDRRTAQAAYARQAGTRRS